MTRYTMQAPAIPFTVVTYVDERGIYQEVRPLAWELAASFERVAHGVVETMSKQAPQDQAMAPFFLVCKKLCTGQTDLNVFWSPTGLRYL